MSSFVHVLWREIPNYHKNQYRKLLARIFFKEIQTWNWLNIAVKLKWINFTIIFVLHSHMYKCLLCDLIFIFWIVHLKSKSCSYIKTVKLSVTFSRRYALSLFKGTFLEGEFIWAIQYIYEYNICKNWIMLTSALPRDSQTKRMIHLNNERLVWPYIT